jgi:hypothetical protein
MPADCAIRLAPRPGDGRHGPSAVRARTLVPSPRSKTKKPERSSSPPSGRGLSLVTPDAGEVAVRPSSASQSLQRRAQAVVWTCAHPGTARGPDGRPQTRSRRAAPPGCAPRSMSRPALRGSGVRLAEEHQPEDHSADQHARTEHVELVTSAAARLEHETCERDQSDGELGENELHGGSFQMVLGQPTRSP